MSYSDKELEEICGILARADQEKQENDIQKMIMHLQFEKEAPEAPQDEDDDVYLARLDSNRAKAEMTKAHREIRELQRQIEQLEGVIREAEKIVRKYKRYVQAESSSKGRGRPETSEFNMRIGKKFVSKWVMSLMEALDVKSCQKLEELLSTHTSKLEFNKVTGKSEAVTILSRATERNWRRWLKGEAIPSYNTFEMLMGTKIDFGKCKGQLLQDIPTTPNSNDIQTLLTFI